MKYNLHLTPGCPVMIRQVGGVILLVPLVGGAEKAAADEQLHAWVESQLNVTVSPAAIQPPVSKTAVAETIRLQASRERYQQRMALMQAQLELKKLANPPGRPSRQSQEPARSPGRPPNPVPPPKSPDDPPFPDPVEALMKDRQAAASRQLDAALAEAERDLAGDRQPPIELPQALP